MPDTVVITRPAAQAGPLAAKIAALGLPVQLLPLLEIRALDGAEECARLQAVLARLRDYALVVFVSPNAIDCVFAQALAVSSRKPAHMARSRAEVVDVVMPSSCATLA